MQHKCVLYRDNRWRTRIGAIFPLRNEDGTLFANAAAAKVFTCVVFCAHQKDGLIAAFGRAGCVLVSNTPVALDKKDCFRTHELNGEPAYYLGKDPEDAEYLATKLTFHAPDGASICLTPGYGDWILDIKTSGGAIAHVADIGGDAKLNIVGMTFNGEAYTLMPKEQTKQAA